MEQPPLIQAEPVAGRKAGVGRIGLYISLAPLAALAAILLFQPGWGSPIQTLGGLIFFVATPLGFVLSLLGVVLNKDRRAGVFGLVITGAFIAFFLVSSFCWVAWRRKGRTSRPRMDPALE